MICKTVVPPPALQQFIKQYLVLHTKFDAGTVPVKAYPVNPNDYQHHFAFYSKSKKSPTVREPETLQEVNVGC